MQQTSEFYLYIRYTTKITNRVYQPLIHAYLSSTNKIFEMDIDGIGSNDIIEK